MFILLLKQTNKQTWPCCPKDRTTHEIRILYKALDFDPEGSAQLKAGQLFTFPLTK